MGRGNLHDACTQQACPLDGRRGRLLGMGWVFRAPWHGAKNDRDVPILSAGMTPGVPPQVEVGVPRGRCWACRDAAACCSSSCRLQQRAQAVNITPGAAWVCSLHSHLLRMAEKHLTKGRFRNWLSLLPNLWKMLLFLLTALQLSPRALLTLSNIPSVFSACTSSMAGTAAAAGVGSHVRAELALPSAGAGHSQAADCSGSKHMTASF